MAIKIPKTIEGVYRLEELGHGANASFFALTRQTGLKMFDDRGKNAYAEAAICYYCHKAVFDNPRWSHLVPRIRSKLLKIKDGKSFRYAYAMERVGIYEYDNYATKVIDEVGIGNFYKVSNPIDRILKREILRHPEVIRAYKENRGCVEEELLEELGWDIDGIMGDDHEYNVGVRRSTKELVWIDFS
jgi:hypothetical protein